jgi:hypothetical protein
MISNIFTLEQLRQDLDTEMLREPIFPSPTRQHLSAQALLMSAMD